MTTSRSSIVRRLAVTSMFALLASAAFIPSARAQCGTGPMIVLDPAATFAYEQPPLVGSPSIVEFGVGSTGSGFGGGPGQSVTTPAGGPWTNIAFNFYDRSTGAAQAVGNVYLFDAPYTGTPQALSVSTPGLLGVGSASGSVYLFPPSLKLLPNTHYFFYCDTRPGGAGGTYLNSPNGNGNFGSAPCCDAAFRLQGIPVNFSTPGSQLTVVGLIHSFCAPFDDLNPADPDSEYTVVLTGLTSQGTTISMAGGTTFYTTTYHADGAPGGISIYRHSPRRAFTSAADMPGSPPNSAVPSLYQTGELVLSGLMGDLIVTVSQTGSNPAVGSYRFGYVFIDGTLRSRINDTWGQGQGLWCVSGCLPPAGGYVARLDGAIDSDLALDSDLDGVLDTQDACPMASAAGQDADANGCVDPTSTMHHVETWALTSLPLHFSFGPTGIPGFTDGSDLAAIRAGFQTWQNVPGASLHVIEDPAATQSTASGMDGKNVITFTDTSYPFPPSVLAVTPTLSSTRRTLYRGSVVLPGQIVDADILFNPGIHFSTPTRAGDWDLQSVATHEIGHLFGLSHSGVRTATMFFVQQSGSIAATLKSDDMEAIAAAYPAPALQIGYGTIRGSVVHGGTGLPVPGALVTAVSLNADNAPMDTVGSDYTRENGSYALFRLPAGRYGVHIQALDGTVLDGLTADFISTRLAAITEADFDPEWYSVPENASDDPTAIQPVVLTPGQETDGIDIVTNIDTTPPTIVSATPANGTNGVSIDATIAVAFSEPVDPATISNALHVHAQGQTTKLTGPGLLANHGQTLFFTPDTPLDYGAPYVVDITTDLTDARGVHLAAPYSAAFSTMVVPALGLSAVQPATVPVGGVITLSGQGFTGTDAIEVHFSSGGGNSVAAPISVVGGTIVARVPNGVAAGADNVSIVVGGGTPSNALALQVVALPPQSIPAPAGSPIALAFAPSGVALSHDGGMLYVVGDGGFATINLDASRPNPRVPISRLTQASQHIRLTPDGTRAVITQPASGGAVLVDAMPTSGTLGTVLDPITLAGSPADVVVDPAGQKAYITDPSRGAIDAADIRLGLPSSGQVIRTLTSSSPLTGGVAIQPDGARLILGAIGGLTGINIADNVQTTLAPFSAAGPVAVDPSGVQIFSPAASGELATGTTDGSLAPSLVATGGQPRDAAVSIFGQSAFVVNGALNQLQVVDVNPASPTFRSAVGQVATGTGPVAITISGNGAVIAVANAVSHSISLYSTGVGGPVLTAVTPNMAMTGDQVVAVNGGGGASTFAGASIDLGSGPLPVARGLAAGASFVVGASPQRATTATVQLADNTRSLSLPFQIVDPIPSAVPFETGRSFVVPPGPCGGGDFGPLDIMRVSPDGRLLAAHRDLPGCGNYIYLYEITDEGSLPFGSLVGTMTVSATPNVQTDFTFSADGKQILAVLQTTDVIMVMDADPSSPHFTEAIATFHAPPALGSPRSIAADPLGRRLLVGGLGIHFLNLDFTIRSFTGAIATDAAGIAITPDGHRAVVGFTGQANFVDMDTETLIGTSPLHPGAGGNNVDRIAITTDGRRAVGLFADGSVSVWNMDPALGAVGAESYHGTPVAAGTQLRSPTPGVDGHSVLFGDALSPGIVRMDVSVTPPVATVLPLPVYAGTLQRSADGRRLFTGVWRTGAPVIADLRLWSLSPATQMSLTSGSGQSATAGSTLPLPVAVRVTDGMGHAQQGVVVAFDLVGSANGSFPGTAGSRIEKISDTNGEASTMWTMPPVAPPFGSPAHLMVSALGVAGASLGVDATVALNNSLIVPVVTAFGPPDGSTGINAGSAVFVKFNQMMSETSLGTHLALFANGAPVAGAMHLENLGQTSIFQPASPLAYAARCSLAVRAGAADTDGQLLAADAHALFSVQATPTVSISSLTPASGPAGSTVVIDGAGFAATLGSNVVSFSGALGTVTAAGLTSLTTTVPLSASSGPVTVQTGTSTSNALTFNVLTPSHTAVHNTGTINASPGIRDIAITPDGTRLYVTDPTTNSLSVFDVLTAAHITSITVGTRPQAVSILPDGTRAFVANTGSNDVSVVDIVPTSANYHKVILTIPVGQTPVDLDISGAGPSVYVLNQGSGTVSVIDARPGNATFDQVTTTVNVGSGSTTIKISADASRMYVTNGAGFEIINVSTQQIVTTVNLGSSGTAIDVTSDASLALVLTAAGQLVVVDLSPGPKQYQVTTTVNVGSGSTTIKISADATLAYVANGDGNTLLVFQITKTTTGAITIQPPLVVTLTLIATIPVGQDPTSLAFDPSGRPVGFVVNSASGTITILGLPSELPPLAILFDVDPDKINLKSECKWVTGLLQPPTPYDASQFVLASILLNGVVPADLTAPHAVGDANHDGVPDLTVQFRRKDLLQILPAGNKVPVTATGQMSDGRAFTGTDSVKVKRPKVMCPIAGSMVTPGWALDVCWETPDGSSVQWVAVMHSMDHGECWELDADHLANTGTYRWQVPGTSADSVLLAVELVESDLTPPPVPGAAPDLLVSGSTALSDYFSIAGTTDAGVVPTALAFAPIRPNPAADAAVIRFGLPQSATVRLDIFDVQGRHVRNLTSGSRAAGWHDLTWNGRSDAGSHAQAGLYFVRFEALGRRFQQRLVWLH